MKSFGNESIGIPLCPNRKIDHRGIVPINQCKVILVNENPAGLTSDEKAAREQIESQQRDQDKIKANADFLKKTKERLKQQRLKSAKNLEEVEKNNEGCLENHEFIKNSFTFMDPVVETTDKNSPEKRKKTTKKKSSLKVLENENLAKKAELNSQKTPVSGKRLENTQKIPRFVSVDNMKIEFNPKMVKKIENSKKQSLAGQESLESRSACTLLKTPEKFKDLEQVRYSVALKTLVSSQMQQKFINRPPVVCTCGAATKNSAKHPKKCANNCPFYKHESEYQRALKEMLTSFKASE